VRKGDVDLERITKSKHFQDLLFNSNGNGDSHLVLFLVVNNFNSLN
jgi:hypothetical protein